MMRGNAGCGEGCLMWGSACIMNDNRSEFGEVGVSGGATAVSCPPPASPSAESGWRGWRAVGREKVD